MIGGGGTGISGVNANRQIGTWNTMTLVGTQTGAAMVFTRIEIVVPGCRLVITIFVVVGGNGPMPVKEPGQKPPRALQSTNCGPKPMGPQATVAATVPETQRQETTAGM
jgi:hypothetical protein